MSRSTMAGGLTHALALRYLHLAQSLASTADTYDQEVPEVATVAGLEQLRTRYLELIDEHLADVPASCRDVLALAQFASTVLADRPIYVALNDSGPVLNEEDRHHAVMALASVCSWLNGRDIAEYIAEARATTRT